VGGYSVQRRLNHSPDAIDILEHIIVPKANEPEALAFQVGSSTGIAFRRMLAAVDLDDQTLLSAAKIDNVTADFDLTAKFQVLVLPGAERIPQLALGVGGVLAKRSRPACQKMPSSHYAPSPRRFRVDPLPQKGEGFFGTVNA
jgi:hypothetical protein